VKGDLHGEGPGRGRLSGDDRSRRR
jgi:hypothetical protein